MSICDSHGGMTRSTKEAWKMLFYWIAIAIAAVLIQAIFPFLAGLIDTL